jgi:hypothetical protein
VGVPGGVVTVEDFQKLDLWVGRLVGLWPSPKRRPEETYECDFPA